MLIDGTEQGELAAIIFKGLMGYSALSQCKGPLFLLPSMV